ncbi:MAG TPA: hypothetical protein VJR23_03420 [Candidatus Acidoferrales bacterium]|nr:hypothetical protein [Candidatus Acidoferrales bacterium]
MISEADVRAKSGDELMDIWSNQIDYVPQVIEWVRSEIERRKLEIRAVPIRTTQEADRNREIKRSFTDVRLLTFVQAIMGLFFFGMAFVSLLEASYPGPPHAGDTLSFTSATIFAVFGLFLFVYAYGVWKRKKWAFASGFYIYVVIAAINALGFALGAVSAFLANDASSVGTLIATVFFTVITARIASKYRFLRKNAGELTAH